MFWDFPGDAVVKNPPADAGDTGSSPGPGRSHKPWSNKARAPQLLTLRSRAREPQLLKPTRLEPVLRNKRSHRSEKPAHRNEEYPPLATTRESPQAATKTQCSQKKKKIKRSYTYWPICTVLTQEIASEIKLELYK